MKRRLGPRRGRVSKGALGRLGEGKKSEGRKEEIRSGAGPCPGSTRIKKHPLKINTSAGELLKESSSSTVSWNLTQEPPLSGVGGGNREEGRNGRNQLMGNIR